MRDALSQERGSGAAAAVCYPERVRSVSLLLTLVLAAPRSSPLSELADRLAEEIVRVAGGRAVEVGTPEDRTGRGATLALDLRTLVLARLEGRLRTDETGPRFRIALVLSETARTLVASGRVVEEPSGRLIDLLSASVHSDPAVLNLSPSPLEPISQTLEITGTSRTPLVEGPVLDIAFLEDDRIALLTPEAVATYRWASPGLVREHREALAGPRVPVRILAGLLRPEEGGSSLWVMTNQIDGATLFGTEGGTLSRRTRAEALPAPGAPEGLRYRPGTNLLEGPVGRLGTGPFLALASTAGVQADGTVVTTAARSPGATPLRSGDRMAPLWGGLLVVSAAGPPGPRDTLVLLEVGDAGVRRRETLLAVEGRVRAIASRPRGATSRLVCAVEEPGEATHLVVLEMQARGTRPGSSASR